MPREYTLLQLAELTKAQLVGEPNQCISNVNALENARENEASFLSNPRYEELLKQSSAGVICVQHTASLPKSKNYLISDDPSRTFQIIAEHILSDGLYTTYFEPIHPSAVIHKTAQLGNNVHIGPNVVIDAYTTIGDNSAIYANTTIGPNSHIGADCTIYHNVCLRERSILGNRVILQPGVIVGSCGFGFTTDEQGKHHKLTQMGNVIIEDDVEIGANTTIDRARFQSTIIHKGTRIDNLVQIAHNVTIGEDCIIVAQSGIAGSTKIGNNVVLGGQSGVVGHIEICSGAIITSKGGVSKSITKPGVYRGEPVQPIKEFSKNKIHLRRISKYAEEIQRLKKKIAEMERCVAAE